MLNPWIVLAVVLAIGSASGGGFLFGRSYEAGEQAKVQNEQALAYAAEIRHRQSMADDLSAHLEAVRAAAAKKNQVITKEVIRYESIVPAERRCDLDGSFRVLHDAAATGNPDAIASGMVAGVSERVTDSAVLETVSENYADCRGYIEQIRGWQRWHSEVVQSRGNSRTGQ